MSDTHGADALNHLVIAPTALRVLIGVLVGHALAGAVVFLAAGTVRLPWCWALLGSSALIYGLGRLSLDPELRHERSDLKATGEDRALPGLAGLCYLALLVVAGLDAGRFHWSQVPWVVQAVGLAVFAGALAIGFWAMRVNRFATRFVRIQSERGHHVISAGPYRWLRHPSYAMAVLLTVAAGPALGSWWAIVPSGPGRGRRVCCGASEVWSDASASPSCLASTRRICNDSWKGGDSVSTIREPETT